MSDIVKRESLFVSPDTLRYTLNSLNHFYENHTADHIGYKHVNGTQYVGHVCNFSSEIFLETRKIQMNHPPFDEVLNVSEELNYYFDLTYSGFVETYNQQSMLVALLRKHVLIDPNFVYSLKFSNGATKTILRSNNSSTYTVYKQTFYETDTAPVLSVTDTATEEVVTYDMFVEGQTASAITKYLFSLNGATEGLYTYDEENNELTIQLSNQLVDIPFIWICVNELNVFPKFDIESFLDVYSRPLLHIGTNGHGTNLLYPYLTEGNTPAVISDDETWYIQAYPEIGIFDDIPNTVKIDRIVYAYGTDVEDAQSHQSRTITYDKKYTSIYLSIDATWLFHTNELGEIDYAYIPLSDFYLNAESNVLNKAAFTVKFDPVYLSRHEMLQRDAYTGIHLDVASEYTDHSIEKKNGLVHELGAFDEIPEYFKYTLSRDIHHIHSELYAIRENDNIPNERPENRQTAALILDSGIPKNEYKQISSNLNVSLPYMYRIPGKEYGGFVFDPSQSTSKTNYLSDAVYVDDNHFATRTDGDHTYDNYPKFIYHGNSVFSLSELGFDPDTEYGRVYNLSNDPSTYENNRLAKHPKPLATVARICDIPTRFQQLIHIRGYAPSLVIDKNYVRNYAPYKVQDAENILNQHDMWVKLPGKRIFAYEDNLNTLVGQDYLESHPEYFITSNISAEVEMTRDESSIITYTVGTPGEDYTVGDEVTFSICGIRFSCIVSEVTESGSIQAFTLGPEFNGTMINIANFDAVEYDITTSASSGSGSGFEIHIKFEETDWDLLHRYTTVLKEGLYAYKFDVWGFIWLWSYDVLTNTWVVKYQITGDIINPNIYESSIYEIYPDLQPSSLNNTNVFLRNLFITRKNYLEQDVTETVTNAFEKEDDGYNYSQEIMDKGYNHIDAKYIVHPSSSSGYMNLTYYTPNEDTYSPISTDTCKYIQPRFHQNNVVMVHDNLFMIDFSQKQPEVYTYDGSYHETYKKQTDISTGLKIVSERRPWMISDVLPSTWFEPSSSDKILKYDLYWSDNKKYHPELQEFAASLEAMSRDELIALIKSKYGTKADPVVMEDSSYEYSMERLKYYLIHNEQMHDPYRYKSAGVSKLRSAGDVIAHTESPVGEQFVGKVTNMTTSTFVSDTTFRGRTETVEPSFVIRVDTTDTFDLDQMRMYDDAGNDISQYTMLILNRQLYMFNKNTEHWMLLRRS